MLWREEEIEHLVEFVGARLVESNYRSVLSRVREGDLVVDCSIGCDTVALIELCMERGALFINSAIDEWTDDVMCRSKNREEDSMWWMHKRLHSIRSRRSSALVSMGCNPGDVSLWCKAGLEYMWLMQRGVDVPRREGKVMYGEMAKDMGVETVHVSECDT